MASVLPERYSSNRDQPELVRVMVNLEREVFELAGVIKPSSFQTKGMDDSITLSAWVCRRLFVEFLVRSYTRYHTRNEVRHGVLKTLTSTELITGPKVFLNIDRAFGRATLLFVA